MKYKGSPSKNPDIKTPLVVSLTLGEVIHFSPLAAFWCQGFSKDFHYENMWYQTQIILYTVVLKCLVTQEVYKWCDK